MQNDYKKIPNNTKLNTLYDYRNSITWHGLFR